MKKKIAAAVFAVLIISQIVLMAACSPAGEKFEMPEINYKTYDNADFSDYTPAAQRDDSKIPGQWENYGIGDPFVMRFNGMYYLYCSSRDRCNGVRAWKSYDMIDWTQCTAEGYEDELTGYVAYSNEERFQGAFAPEVYYFNGMFYMYSSPASKGHYVWAADSPEGPFQLVTENYGMSIDGSVFIDDDESMYFLNAGTNGIVLHDMVSMNEVGGSAYNLNNTTIGPWTEGPMIIKRDGIYYLTYTGADVESQSYRIGYNTEKDGNSLLSRDAFGVRGVDLPIILTVDEENNFKGLGHSSTVMGPDLDSYYIVYHSLNQLTPNGPYRSMNIDRLIFNGTQMSVDESKTNSVAAAAPAFYAENTDENGKFTKTGNVILSNASAASVFTAEFSFIGSDVKNIVGYTDANNYHYVQADYAGHKITLNKVAGGKTTEVASGQLKNDFKSDVLHTVRIAYANGEVDVYFDNMCKISGAETEISAGKIGYEGSAEFKCTTFSNCAKGYSDRIELKQSGASIGASNYLPENYFEGIQSYNLASGALTKLTVSADDYPTDAGYDGAYALTLRGGNQFARYLTYFREEGHYGVKLTYDAQYCGKKIGVQVNGGDVQTVTLPKYTAEEGGKMITAFIADVDIEKAGPNIITLYGAGQAVQFVSFSFEKKAYGDFSFENSLDAILENGAVYSTMFRIYDGGHATREGSRMLVYIGDDTLSDYELEVKIKFLSDSPSFGAGVVLRARNFANARNDGLQAIQGYYVALDNRLITVSKLDHGYSRTNMEFESHGKNTERLLSEYFTLRVLIHGNTMEVYLDDQFVTSITDAHPFLTGHVGLYTDGAEVVYKDLKIKAYN